MGNGLANIVAAIIVAGALLFNGGLFGGGQRGAPAANDAEFAEWYARAVGDIRNDIVVNCGCCGEGQRRAGGDSF